MKIEQLNFEGIQINAKASQQTNARQYQQKQASN